MKNQVFITSYAKDFKWLEHCLFSLIKFGVNWLPPVVCVSAADLAAAQTLVDRVVPGQVEVVVKDGYGFMRAQVAMMEADQYCPEADNIFLVGSDCIAYAELDPSMYCDDHGRPVVLFTPREVVEVHIRQCMPWLIGTERVLGVAPKGEFMRRLPSVFPRSIFAPMREEVELLHGDKFEEYIIKGNVAKHDTSEANILGCFAYEYMHDTCCWVNTSTDDFSVWKTALLQMWSHGGLDLPMDACSTLPDGTSTVGRKPREVIAQILYGGDESRVKLN